LAKPELVSILKLAFGAAMADDLKPQSPSSAGEIANLAAEVASDAHIDLATLRADEKKFLEEHALRKPLRVPHIWALGVGAVITGEYFGWNPGLREGARWGCSSHRCLSAVCIWPGCCRYRS
jgi:hypothetical protein